MNGGSLEDILLSATGLTARRGAREVLTGVSFTVRRGEILGVIGPNGAGKTTLFECVAGLLPLRSGEVTADRRAVFYVPDAIRPWPDQTVRWTIGLTTNVFSCPSRASILEELDLIPLLDARAGTLSKGEAKRLGIALGLTQPRPLILFDEPFDGLDLRQTRQVMNLLRTVVTREQRTLVLSIHQLSDAARVCDRFLLLDHGRAVAIGTLGELLARTSTQAATLEEVFLALT